MSEIRDRLTKIECDQKKIAEALKNIQDDVEAEWGVALVKAGEEIAGVKFE